MRRVFRQFSWLEIGSGKTALSRPAHKPLTGSTQYSAELPSVGTACEAYPQGGGANANRWAKECA